MCPVNESGKPKRKVKVIAVDDIEQYLASRHQVYNTAGVLKSIKQTIKDICSQEVKDITDDLKKGRVGKIFQAERRYNESIVHKW
jgi:hypothetical protein